MDEIVGLLLVFHPHHFSTLDVYVRVFVCSPWGICWRHTSLYTIVHGDEGNNSDIHPICTVNHHAAWVNLGWSGICYTAQTPYNAQS